MFLKYRGTTALFTALSIVYLLQSLLVKPDAATLAKYHISTAQAAGLSLTIALPYIVIWFVALASYLALRNYTASIATSKDGAAFTQICQGVFWLILWLPVSAIVASVSSQLYHAHPEATANLTRLNNYLNILLLLPGFWIINAGSKKLTALVKSHSPSPSQLATLAFIGFSALYTFLVVSDPARLHSTALAPVASYYSANWLVVLTIVIPRLIMWYLGIQAMKNIYIYRQKIKGVLYKAALNNLARGIGGIVLATIVLRCIQSLSSWLGSLSLGLLLLTLYALLIVLAVGYALLAKGARSLQKIEEL